MRKIRWGRVIGTMTLLGVIVGGSVFAYNSYQQDLLEISKLQQVVYGSPVGEQDASMAPVKPQFPLIPEVIQANRAKLKNGEFTGIKAIVFKDRKAPGQTSFKGGSSVSDYYDIAYWGPGSGVENDEFVRVKLTDSDRTKLDLLATQYPGQYAGYEIEFVDNGGHFTVLRLVVCALPDSKAQPQPQAPAQNTTPISAQPQGEAQST